MPEYITTRTYYSKSLDNKTYSELKLIAKKLGILRKIIWHQFSSNPKKLNDREIRDQWLNAKNNETNFYPKNHRSNSSSSLERNVKRYDRNY